jgi:hypothetical protein
MWQIIIMLSVSGFFILGIAGCFTKKSTNTNAYADSTATSTFDTIKGPVSKSEIQERLIELSKSVTPAKLNQGAMCYEMSAPLDRYEYVCPKCGEKTLYTSDEGLAEKASEIESYRISVTRMNGLDISLDESEFCKKCSPDIKTPVLYINIKYKDDPLVHKICCIGHSDFALMYEFLCGSKVHRLFNVQEVPLKNYIEQLQFLFDISIKQ